MDVIVENAQILIISDDYKIVWKGFFGDHPALKAELISDQSSIIVLHNYEGWDFTTGLNLRAYRTDGKILWCINGYESRTGDPVVDFQIERDRIAVNTWFGKRITINALTGKVQSTQFTK